MPCLNVNHTAVKFSPKCLVISQYARVSQFECCAETGVGTHLLTEQQNTQQSKALKSLLIL